MKASRDDAPEAAGEVAQHGEPEAAHADQHPEQVAEQIGAQELGAVREEASAESKKEHDGQTETGPLQPFEGGASSHGFIGGASPAGLTTLCSSSARL